MGDITKFTVWLGMAALEWIRRSAIAVFLSWLVVAEVRGSCRLPQMSATTRNRTRDGIARVARKPQAPTIRTQMRHRELIANGSARSVEGRAMYPSPAGASGMRRKRPGVGDAFRSVAFASERALRRSPR